MNEKQERIKYWSKKLLEVSAESSELHKTWHANLNLEFEETYKAMSLLMDVRAYSALLSETLAQPDPPKPTLIKRLLKK